MVDLDVVWESEPYSHCNFTALDSLDHDLAERWVTNLQGMDWDDPEHRRVLELEGLRRWERPVLSGYDSLIAAMDAQLARCDRQLAGEIAHQNVPLDAQTRDRYLSSALMEEAIHSSLFEGAVSTREAAKDLLRTERAPINRDERMIADPDRLIIDRPRPRQHLAFGFGIHRCVGNRLAEMQLRIVWEEILKRFPKIEVLEEPKRVYSTFVKGYERMMVRIPERN